MENLQTYEIRRVAPNQDEFELILYFDGQLTEFAGELGTVPKDKKDITSLAKQILNNKYPFLKVTLIKVILGGVAAASIPLTDHSTTAHAEDSNGNTPAQMAHADSIYYHVASGDTLWGLSVKFGTSVDNIKRANHLTSDILKVNQLLIIPKAFHTVASGDYLTVLAKKYGTTVEGIKQANNMNSDATFIGQTLIIPILIGSEPSNGEAREVTPTAQNQAISTYTVVSGDSLSVIAKRFGTSVEALRSSNQLTSDLIRVGQILTIPQAANEVQEPSPAQPPAPVPSSEPAFNQYTVVAGDTLWGISAKFKVSLDALRKANDLQIDMLHIGQTLIIPNGQEVVTVITEPTAPAKTVETKYTVVPGDTVYSIMKRYNITAEQLKQANQLTSDILKVGQVLIIPTASGAPVAASPASGPVQTAAPGVDLATVQKNLQILGYYTVPTMTGSYDTPTTQAIKTFQADYSLPVTGTINEATNTAINHAVVKKELVRDTAKYLGVPYKWGGVTPNGFDCSGFVYYMFNQHGVTMSRNTSGGLYNTGTAIDRSHLQPGDLVFFAVNTPGTISHVGFYIGDNQFVSATTSKGIAAYPLDTGYWAKYYVGAKRVY
ncbi:LysM peptidoglycan-binding domain-containing protein [Neobacillus sp. SAB-20_R2A]|uniref:C40 family peptidase n=1 Tax=Neobacillus sp. SAB-20_R2A TaxID=3120519 RepID=UPI003C6DD82C